MKVGILRKNWHHVLAKICQKFYCSKNAFIIFWSKYCENCQKHARVWGAIANRTPSDYLSNHNISYKKEVVDSFVRSWIFNLKSEILHNPAYWGAGSPTRFQTINRHRLIIRAQHKCTVATMVTSKFSDVSHWIRFFYVQLPLKTIKYSLGVQVIPVCRTIVKNNYKTFSYVLDCIRK